MGAAGWFESTAAHGMFKVEISASARDALVRLLEREQFDETQASGACTMAIDQEIDKAYRRGHNARARSLIALLKQGDVEAGLTELRDSMTYTPIAREVCADDDCPDCIAEGAGV